MSTIANASSNASNIDTVAEQTNDTLLYIFFVFISILSITGNGVVCIVFKFESEIFGSITNILILNQSIIDLCSAIIFAILKFAPGVPGVLSDRSSAWFTIVCLVWISEYSFWSLSYASTFNLVLLSIERYFAICLPIRHRKLFTKLLVKRYSSIPWIAAFIIQIYLPLVHHVTEDRQCKFQWPNENAQIFTGTFVFMTEYLIPLIIMTSSYTMIWISLRKRLQSKSSGTANAFTKGKRNVTITLCLVFISYVICWSPDAFVYFYFNLGGDYNFQSTAHHFVMILVLCNMLTNPCIYSFKYEKFRQQLQKLLCRCCYQRSSADNFQSSKASTNEHFTSIRQETKAEVPTEMKAPSDDNKIMVAYSRKVCYECYVKNEFTQTEEYFV